MYYVVNEEILVAAPDEISTGASEHEGDSEYSGTVYNGGLDLMPCHLLPSIVLKYIQHMKVKELLIHDINNNLVNSQVVDIPVTDNEEYIKILNWEIPEGNNYIITTNFDMNNQNFGDNNPLLRRTTDDLQIILMQLIT